MAKIQRRFALAERAEKASDKYLRALLICAPGHQGGHSYTGGEIADALGIPFPVTMPDLRRFATDHGFMPYDLWPWLKKLDELSAEVGPKDQSHVE